jgi:opacity protein-like surface antigen
MIPDAGMPGNHWRPIFVKSSMRPLLLLFAGAVSAFSGPLSVGIKAGVPLTDFFDTVRSPNYGFNTNTKRYVIGPTVELHLPFGLGVEFDALYRRVNYEGTNSLVDVFVQNRTTGNAWEFPLLVKYRFATAPFVRPYVDAGVAFDTLSGLKQTLTRTPFPGGTTTTTSSSSPQELRHNNATGFVIGAGVDVHFVIHLMPEVRYTRWGSEHFADVNGALISNRNQAEFLLGITF